MNLAGDLLGGNLEGRATAQFVAKVISPRICSGAHVTPMVHESKKRRIAPAGRRRVELVIDAPSVAASPLPRDASIFNEKSGSVFSTVAQVAGGSASGTIGAAVVPVEDRYFGGEADAVARNDPFPPAAGPAEGHPVRASDLIAELREIAGQVTRMMAQVERAIDRFAINAG